MTDEQIDRGCTCHDHPPCDFCTSLNEEEATAYWNGGMEALKKLHKERRNLDVLILKELQP
jgi:hypothetical protein